MEMDTLYLGLSLKSPLIVGASRLDGTVIAQECQAAGAGMIVMHSLFEEQFAAERAACHWSMEHGAGPDDDEWLEDEDPDEADAFPLRPEEYYERLAKLKHTLSIPVAGSINGTTPGNWVLYAQEMEEAGADAIELNLYDPVMDPAVPGSEIEERVLQVVKLVRRAVHVPLAVKLCPFYTSVAHMARQMDNLGVDGIVLFNRFYQPDFDISSGAPRAARCVQLSTPDELPLRLHWTAALCGKIRASIAVTGGLHSGIDVIKAILAGANTVQIVSAILKNGPAHLRTIRADMEKWMSARGLGALSDIRGALSLDRVINRETFERSNYVGLLREQDAVKDV